MSEEWKAQYNKAGRLFWGVDAKENPGVTPEARSRLCVCQASFLMTFTMGWMPHAGTQKAVNVPSCFELILGLTIESVQWNQVYMEWIGTSGSSGMVGRPLEFLSTFKLRPHHLSCDRNAGIPFPGKQRNGPSSPDEEAKTGLFLNCFGTLGIPRVETGMSGNFLSCLKGVKDPFVAQEGRWD